MPSDCGLSVTSQRVANQLAICKSPCRAGNGLCLRHVGPRRGRLGYRRGEQLAHFVCLNKRFSTGVMAAGCVPEEAFPASSLLCTQPTVCATGSNLYMAASGWPRSQ